MTFACYRAPASLAYNLDFKKYNQIKSFKKARVREARTTLSQEKLHKRHCLRIFQDYVVSEFSAVLDNAESIVTLLFLLLRNWINLMAVPRWNKWFLLLFIITIECCFDSVLATFKAFSLPVNGTTRVQKVCGWTFISYSNGYRFLKQQTS